MRIHLENICPDFLAFWDWARERSPAEQRQLWRALYEDPNRDIFDVYYSRWGDPDRLEAALHRFEEAAPRVRAIAPEAARAIRHLGPECAQLFGAPHAEVRYVLMVGLFTSDGWATHLRGEPTSFLALEWDQYSRRRDLEIMVAHEAAHSVHDQCGPFRPDSTVVGEGLFAEGLAQLASTILAPGAPEAAYLCPGGERTMVGQDCAEWVAECDRRWPELRRWLLRDLERSEVPRFAAYFWGPRHHTDPDPHENVPVRAGYVVGYRVVSALSRHHNIAAMARWPAERAVAEVRQALEQMPGPATPL